VIDQGPQDTEGVEPRIAHEVGRLRRSKARVRSHS